MSFSSHVFRADQRSTINILFVSIAIAIHFQLKNANWRVIPNNMALLWFLLLLHLPPTFASFSTGLLGDSPSLKPNWTVEYGNELAMLALDFAAAAYAPVPDQCLAKHGARLVMRAQVPCDAIKDECWAYIAQSPQLIVFGVRGTRTRAQLIIEIIESMSEPKKTFPAGGSVQHYFFESLQAIWDAGMGDKLRQLKMANPELPVLFTGHSLGGALVSLASTQFAADNNETVGPEDLLLVTFGQPRVGNMEYARAHDRLVPNSFRLVHRYDLVPHLPYCYVHLRSPHRCTSGHNHGPFHHGTEIWYPAEGMEPRNSLFHICEGHPFGEDQNCSNAYFVHFQTADHFVYFGQNVDSYGNSGCQPNATGTSRRRWRNGTNLGSKRQKVTRQRSWKNL